MPGRELVTAEADAGVRRLRLHPQLAFQPRNSTRSSARPKVRRDVSRNPVLSGIRMYGLTETIFLRNPEAGKKFGTARIRKKHRLKVE